LLADREGKIVALHTTLNEFPLAVAQANLNRSLQLGHKAAWWYSGTQLYQVVTQPFYDDAVSKSALSGTVVVGRRIDPAELGRISSSQIALRLGSNIVSSTLGPFRERELARHLTADGGLPKNVDIEGERFFAQSVDLTTSLQPVSIVVLKSYSVVFADLQKQNRLLAGLGLAAILMGVAVAFVISDRFTRPLGNLVAGVHALERNDYGYMLETSGTDEVADVTRAFDRMRKTLKSNEVQKQELENQLRQAQKMEAVGRLAGGVAHDFNNLLTVIKGHGDLMLDRLQSGEPFHFSAQQIDRAAVRGTALTRQLLAFSRMQVLQAKPLDLNTLVSEMSGLLKRLIREDISFSFYAAEFLERIKADPRQIVYRYFSVSTLVPFRKHIQTGQNRQKSDETKHSNRTKVGCLGMLVLGVVVITASAQDGRKLIAQPVPAYPEIARRAKLSGTVKVQVLIAPDGRVKDVKVIGGHPLFVDATIEALKKWKYMPSNAEATATLEFNFHP